jgi:sec-independent protein translocase protein TatC
MPASAHLRELRSRLVRASLAVVVGVVIGWFLSDVVLDLVRVPIEELAASREATLNYASVSSAFDLRLRIAIYCGSALAGPVLLWQALAFALPGLTRKERGWAVGFIATAVPLFAAGCAAGAWIFPHIVEVLAGFAPVEDSTVLDAAYYVDFVLKLVLVSGVAFVSPVFVVLLNVIGVLPGRTIVRSWRVVIVAVVVFCAVATPAADVASMFLLAVPLCLLFAGAAGVALLHDRAAARRLAATARTPTPASTDAEGPRVPVRS